jgi:cytochrome c2
MKALAKTALLGVALVWSANAFAAGDAAKGEATFKAKCKMCHAVGPTAKPGIGPVQNGLIGATAGARPGYKYSSAMKAAGEKGLVWTEETLNKYLEDPKAVVPGTKMVFPGLKKAEDRENVIAYLKTQTGK